MRKRISVIMAALMMATMGTGTAFAAGVATPSQITNSTEEVTDYDEADMPSVDDMYTGASKKTEVETAQSATFTVIIPRQITLDGRKGQANDADYEVTVIADLPGDQVVNVVPDSSFKMSTKGKSDITATVTQEETKWSVALDGADALMADAGVSKAGNVAIENLTAGSWKGQFDFHIFITDGNGEAV